MKNNSKLNTQEKQFILQQLAQFEPAASIQLELMNQFGKDISVQNIYSNYSMRYKDEIQQLRNEYITDFAGLAIAHKKWRLAQRERLYKLSLSKGDHITANKILDSAWRELEAMKLEINKTDSKEDFLLVLKDLENMEPDQVIAEIRKELASDGMELMDIN